MICPRCGTSRPPIGPRHSLDGWGRACVRYACYGCGYCWTEHPQEQEHSTGVARLPVRLEPRRGALASKPDQDVPVGSSRYRAAG